ncbi:amidase [Amylocarpus encephaloides]|uniref:Amidase n=1 Tax=Amylocarpus encephaloides TaxID=45428 RepID=A0A9P7YAV0_9HELO|nr:amidase [Amylocarpus encephaloides]
MSASELETYLQRAKCRGVDIEECSISQLQKYLSKGTFTSRDLTQCYLQKITRINPRLRAVIETNPDALDIADRLDAECRAGHIRSPLHGIPFLAKDNVATKDRMQTTAGCAALTGTIVSEDARVITLLRDAGAVLLGKANLSEFASMRSSYYAEGYSSRGGLNRNPYNLQHNTGGSSSGSASSVASNMCAFSIGTETDGSVMFPADRNAVVGIKPTVGLTSMRGVIPEAPSMDTVGPFGRSVEDAVTILGVIRERGESEDLMPYTTLLSKKDTLHGAKFGLPWKRVWESVSHDCEYETVYKFLMGVIHKIEEAGAQIIKVDLPSAGEIMPPDGWDWTYGEGKTHSKFSEFEVVRSEFYHSLQVYLDGLEKNEKGIRSLEDIVAYNIENTTVEGGVPGTHRAWPLGQDNFHKAIETKDQPKEIYIRALEYVRRKSREEGIDAALQHEGKQLDGLLVPLQAEGGVACSVAAKAGYRMITVPVDIDKHGVPFGIAIIQTACKEDLLIKYGSAIEDLVRGRTLPRFLNLEAKNYPYVG